MCCDSAFLNKLFVKKEMDALLKNKVAEVPIWVKTNLTLEETAAYSGIGINRIREISNNENCPFVLWVGNKRMIKRRLFDEYIERQYSI